MVGGVNEAVVIEMFQAYQMNFRDQFHVVGDDSDKVNRRCAYTREHKLAAIDYALNTWERDPVIRQLIHISRYFAANTLKIERSLLTR
jgi:hypothetical protein